MMKIVMMMVGMMLLHVGCCWTFPAQPSTANNRPVIGILSQPAPKALTPYGSAYIAASYVKYAEAAGCQVVPIDYNGTNGYLTSMFQQVNGLIFPGGGTDIGPDSQLYKAAQLLFSLALQANDRGDYFPIAGHCLGYEMLAQLIANNNFDILSPVDAENMSLPLDFVAGVRSDSRLFSPQQCPQSVYDILQHHNVTLNNHQWAVTPDDFSRYLAPAARMLSLNSDRQGQRFVSTFEMVDYPIWAIQWHAEKPLFEWNPSEAINHSAQAIEAMSWLSRYTGQQARFSLHQFKSPAALSQQVIYNYCPMYTEALIPDFEQCYLFGPPSNSSSSAPPPE